MEFGEHYLEILDIMRQFELIVSLMGVQIVNILVTIQNDCKQAVLGQLKQMIYELDFFFLNRRRRRFGMEYEEGSREEAEVVAELFVLVENHGFNEALEQFGVDS